MMKLILITHNNILEFMATQAHNSNIIVVPLSLILHEESLVVLVLWLSARKKQRKQ